MHLLGFRLFRQSAKTESILPRTCNDALFFIFICCFLDVGLSFLWVLLIFVPTG